MHQWKVSSRDGKGILVYGEAYILDEAKDRAERAHNALREEFPDGSFNVEVLTKKGVKYVWMAKRRHATGDRMGWFKSVLRPVKQAS